MATTNYLWDEPHRCILSSYDFLESIAEVNTVGIGVGALLLSVQQTGRAVFMNYDATESVRSLSDMNAFLVASYTYTGFGQLVASDEVASNTWKYLGGLLALTDVAEGLVLLHGDVYESGFGRWISSRSKGAKWAGNTYIFSSNNPNIASLIAMQEIGAWSHSLEDEKDDAGIDCDFGYELKIAQTFTARVKGAKATPGTQTWQTNDRAFISIINFRGECGVSPADPAERKMVVLDVHNIGGMGSPIKITDTVGLAQKVDDPIPESAICMALEIVDKKLGFRPYDPRNFRPIGRELPPGKHDLPPNDEKVKTARGMMGPFLTARTTYFYLNKSACCGCGEDVIKFAKATVARQGQTWEDIPSKWEEYTYGKLGNWFAACGNSTTGSCCND